MRMMWADGSGVPANRLTPREWEVAALVAEGRTDRQISSALTVSVETARSHTKNILQKLGFHRRAQLAAWWYSSAVAERPDLSEEEQTP